MKTTVPYTTAILQELEQALAGISAESVDQLTRLIGRADRIYVAGAGRSGLMARSFAMRLMHTGRPVYVAGETVTPAIGGNDLLLIASGSGETKSLAAMAAKARELGAAVAAVTVAPESTIGRMADVTVHIPAVTKAAESSGRTSVQPMGSLFEQSLLLFFDGVILRLMEEQGILPSDMYGRHANLE